MMTPKITITPNVLNNALHQTQPSPPYDIISALPPSRYRSPHDRGI
ncbi:hypothetical protein MOTT27_02692 [Mycobacterium intracellulare subsp. yongonense]|nr:hypothetical protein MOTT27_02692 [Mycobacterium intracellulare subsp. yongonense]ETZ54770.1 hypothetical protein L840_4314 [Mycobacterium sp. MAC_011194_8550]ETZ69171.1 hypothetical protein L841_1374 [Mycobacterium sp. MAC_080597_8934]